ncbi:MAG: arylsulfatase [Anaerohalosphaera sp.]|nr:arylsulfatase [Anaerohalosphaera sp.]
MKTINRRTFLKVAGLGAVTLTAGSLLGMGRESKERPNIIFIMADDLGYGDVSCLNLDSKIPTPNIDRLAKLGITFTDAHSNAALCSPTRYGVLTGRYSWRRRRTGGALWSFDLPLIEKDRATVPKYLKDHGYHTACIGKWHLGMNWRDKDGNILEDTGAEKGWNIDFTRPLENGPRSVGFDYFFGMDAPNYPPYCYIENDRTIGIPMTAKPTSMHGVPGVMMEDWDLLKVLPELERRAMKYIDGRAKSGKPFFLYLPLTAPHTPIAPTKEHVGTSGAGPYGDFVHQLDAVVGNILDTVDSNGLAENTLVIFTSDNGSPRLDGTDMGGVEDSILRYGHNPSYVFRGRKADVWEGGHHVPFFARWAGSIPPGIKSDEVICLTDLFATAAAVVGDDLDENAGVDSYNILPVMTGEPYTKPLREATVHLASDGSFSIRQGKWKLELCPGSGGSSLHPEAAMQKGLPMIQLYDLDEDIGETENLHDKYPEVVHRLTGLLEKYVVNGRSTPGAVQKNNGLPDIWISLKVRDIKYDTNPVKHLAVGKKVRMLNNSKQQFTKKGLDVLTDGTRASSLYNDGYWTGIESGDLEVVVDMEEILTIDRVSAGFLESQEFWIFYPRRIEVSLSTDGRKYHSLKSVINDELRADDNRNIKDFSVRYSGKQCRYIKVKAEGLRICPGWHKGAGGKAWLFADEIIVE